MISALTAILSRPRSVLTMMVVMVLAGIYVYVTIPKEADPDIDIPFFYVSIVQDGISPEDSERLLIRPMETHLRGLDGLKELTGVASQGHAGIILEFNVDADHAKATADLREKVDQGKADLPQDAEEPVVTEINFGLFPVMVVTLSGNVPERTLYLHARRLKDQIEAIPSVLEANLAGHREELLEVVIDPARLESYDISQDELIRAVTNNNRLIAAGSLDTGKGRFNVKVPGLFETANDVYGLPVKVSGDSVVTLSDVAEIRRTFKDATTFSRFNGEPTIAIQVIKRIGTNIVENNREVRRVVAEFSKNWPESIRIGFALDQSKFIFEVLGSLQSAIMTAIALVMIVVVAALGLRSALLVGVAIPASFMIGFLLIGLLGMTVNMMLMFGMVLTVGMLVDGAIVIVEYADRKMAEGMERGEAYRLAAQRMFWPIASSTATTLAAFLPLLLWPGVPGEFMSYLPITVIIVLSASLVTAMVFLPVLGSIFGKSEAQAQEAALARQLSGASQVDYHSIPGLSGTYVRLLETLIRHPAKVIVASLALLMGVFFAFGKFSNGVEFFVDTEPEQAMVLVSARGNLSADEELKLVREVEDRILSVHGVKAVFTNTGAPPGGPAVGRGAGIDSPNDQIGQITIELDDYEKRRKGKIVLQEMREKTADLAGIKVEVRKRDDGPATGKDIRLEVNGPDRAAVDAATARIREHLDTQMTGLRDVEDTRPLPGIEWVVTVDRKEAGRYGTDVASVGGMIQMVTNGILVGKYRPDDSEDEVDIRIRLPQDDRTINQLDALRVATPKGLVPIGNFVTRQAVPRVDTITRTNGRHSMMVKANTMDGVLADTKVKELDAWLKTQTWPDNVNYRFRGADQEQKESGAFLGKAMVGALFLMFIILVTQFNSFYQSFITLSTIVLSLIGVLIGMMVTGQTFSIIMTGTGVVALAGIVVNNSIVLIDTYNRLRGLGINPIDATLRCCAQRLRPVMLTTITTICGLLPMAMQINVDFFTRTIQVGSITSIWWVQLSTAIIFGLGFATLLTLILTPTLLAMPEVYRRAWARRRGRTEIQADEADDGRRLAEAAE
ncbi:MAG: efflux RND transporter permease subunit [Pseudomonadota bacterium]|nr:efflux RND transporter permease subunit [Pseudomonadota bacterium]